MILVISGLGLACPTPGFVSYVTDAGYAEKWNLVNYDARVHTNIVNPATHSIRYFLAQDAYSSANRLAELNAARACFAQWQAVPNSVLRFEEGGLASGALDVNTTDHTNLVFWAKSSTIVNNGNDNIAGAT